MCIKGLKSSPRKEFWTQISVGIAHEDKSQSPLHTPSWESTKRKAERRGDDAERPILETHTKICVNRSSLELQVPVLVLINTAGVSQPKTLQAVMASTNLMNRADCPSPLETVSNDGDSSRDEELSSGE